MTGNTLGEQLTLTSFGESHGKCIGMVLDGCPSGLPLSESDLQSELDKTKAWTINNYNPEKRRRQSRDIIRNI